MCIRKKVDEVTLTIDDLKELELYLTCQCGLDSLDMMEILAKIERMKDISLNI